MSYYFGYRTGGYYPYHGYYGYRSYFPMGDPAFTSLANYLRCTRQSRSYSGYCFPGFSHFNYTPRPVGSYFYHGAASGGYSPNYYMSWWAGPAGFATYMGYGPSYGYGHYCDCDPYYGYGDPYGYGYGYDYGYDPGYYDRGYGDSGSSRGTGDATPAEPSSGSDAAEGAEESTGVPRGPTDVEPAAPPAEDSEPETGPWDENKSVLALMDFIDNNSNGLRQVESDPEAKKITLGPKESFGDLGRRHSKKVQYATELWSFLDEAENRKKFQELIEKLPKETTLALGPSGSEIKNPKAAGVEKVYSALEGWEPTNPEAKKLSALGLHPQVRYFAEEFGGDGTAIEKPRIGAQKKSSGDGFVVNVNYASGLAVDEKRDRKKVAALVKAIRELARWDYYHVYVAGKKVDRRLTAEKFIGAVKSGGAGPSASVSPVAGASAGSGKKDGDSGDQPTSPVDQAERIKTQALLEQHGYLDLDAAKFYALLDEKNNKDDLPKVQSAIDAAKVEYNNDLVKYWSAKKNTAVPDIKPYLKHFHEKGLDRSEAKKLLDEWAANLVKIGTARDALNELMVGLVALNSKLNRPQSGDTEQFLSELGRDVFESRVARKNIDLPEREAKLPPKIAGASDWNAQLASVHKDAGDIDNALARISDAVRTRAVALQQGHGKPVPSNAPKTNGATLPPVQPPVVTVIPGKDEVRADGLSAFEKELKAYCEKKGYKEVDDVEYFKWLHSQVKDIQVAKSYLDQWEGNINQIKKSEAIHNDVLLGLLGLGIKGQKTPAQLVHDFIQAERDPQRLKRLDDLSKKVLTIKLPDDGALLPPKIEGKVDWASKLNDLVLHCGILYSALKDVSPKVAERLASAAPVQPPAPTKQEEASPLLARIESHLPHFKKRDDMRLVAVHQVVPKRPDGKVDPGKKPELYFVPGLSKAEGMKQIAALAQGGAEREESWFYLKGQEKINGRWKEFEYWLEVGYNETATHNYFDATILQTINADPNIRIQSVSGVHFHPQNTSKYDLREIPSTTDLHNFVFLAENAEKGTFGRGLQYESQVVTPEGAYTLKAAKSLSRWSESKRRQWKLIPMRNVTPKITDLGHGGMLNVFSDPNINRGFVKVGFTLHEGVVPQYIKALFDQNPWLSPAQRAKVMEMAKKCEPLGRIRVYIGNESDRRRSGRIQQVQPRIQQTPVAPSVRPQEAVNTLVIPKSAGGPGELKLGGVVLHRVDDIRQHTTSRKHVFALLSPTATPEQVETELRKFTGKGLKEESWAFVEFEEGGKRYKVLVECGENESPGAVYVQKNVIRGFFKDRGKVVSNLVVYHNHPRKGGADGNAIPFHPMSYEDVVEAVKYSRGEWFGKYKYKGNMEYRVVTPYGVYATRMNPKLTGWSRSEYNGYLRTAKKAAKKYSDNSSNIVPHKEYAKALNVDGIIDSSFRYFEPVMEPVLRAYFKYDAAMAEYRELVKRYKSFEKAPYPLKLIANGLIKKALNELKVAIEEAQRAGARDELLDRLQTHVWKELGLDAASRA